jgi:hypothetical protein
VAALSGANGRARQGATEVERRGEKGAMAGTQEHFIVSAMMGKMGGRSGAAPRGACG